jgi:alcohol dehydrogenase class IV
MKEGHFSARSKSLLVKKCPYKYRRERNMQFKFHMPVKAYFGEGCIKQYGSELGVFGKRAMIVTGGRSAKASGALDDIIEVLKGLSVEFYIFDKVENNPSTDNVAEGGAAARQFGAGFVIGIGGGSPLDAAKAVAVLATNDIGPERLFENSFKNKPLPIIAIPTTAGTGSEVTPYSVLTRKELQTKGSFGTPDTFPAIAFLDPVYTETQPTAVTVNTAIDALSHNVEGYLSRRSTPASDILAQEGIRLFGECKEHLAAGQVSREVRGKLLYASMLGGMVIAHTGTTIVHGAGYNYTYFKDIPHGKANGYLMAEYLRFNYGHAREKTENILALMGLTDIDGFDTLIASLIGKAPGLSDEEISKYAAITMSQRSTASNIRPVQAQDIEEIFRKVQA